MSPHHTNAYISFMQYSNRNAGERDRWARRVRWAQAQCWVCVEPKEHQGKQLSMIPCTHLNWCNSYFIWVLLGYIYSMLSIAFLYLLLCIALPWFVYPCPCHLLVNELLNLNRCLAMLRVLYHLIGKVGQESSHLSGYPWSHLFGLSHVGLEE